jgi:hypothetical protein
MKADMVLLLLVLRVAVEVPPLGGEGEG